jgi:CHAT domain
MDADERIGRLAFAGALYQQGEMRQAEAILESVEFDAAEQTDDLYVHYCLLYGSILAESGRFLAARRHFERAEALARISGDNDALSIALFNLANVLKYSGARRLACRKYREALACAENESEPQRQLTILLAIANECLADADDPAAQLDDLLSQVARLTPDEDKLDPVMRWSLQAARGKRASIKGDLPSTISHFRCGLTWARQSGNRSHEAEALYMLAQALMVEGSTAQAVDVLVEAERTMAEIGDHRVQQVRDLLRRATQEDNYQPSNPSDISISSSAAEDSAAERFAAEGSAGKGPAAEHTDADDSTVDGCSGDRAPAKTMSSVSSSEFPLYFLPQGATIIDQNIDEISRILPQNGGALCVVYDEGAYLGFVPDGKGMLVIKTQTLTPRGLIDSDIIDRYHLPALLSITAPIVRSGIEHRHSQNYEQAVTACNFSLQVAVLDQSAGGVCNIASNLLLCWLDLRALGKGAPWRPGKQTDKPGSVADDRLLPVSIEAGTLLTTALGRKGTQGSDAGTDTADDRELGRGEKLLAEIAAVALAILPEVERLVELSIRRKSDEGTLASQLALHRLLLVSGPDRSLEQSLLPAWAGGGMVGPGPSDEDFRRRALTSEILALSRKVDRLDAALETVYLELGRVYLSEILGSIGINTTPSSQFSKLVEGAETRDDCGFNLIWQSYERFRHEVPRNTSSLSVINTCNAAIKHLSRLRALAVSSGSGSAHVASYGLTRFLTKVSRDLVTLLLANNFCEEALAVSEETCSRALADWMARTHLTNRLLLRQNFAGSVGEVYPATVEEIVRAAASNQSLILFFVAIGESFRVCLIAPNGEVLWDQIKLPLTLLERLFQSLPYGIDSFFRFGSERSFDTFFLDLSSSRELDDLLDEIGRCLLPAKIASAIEASPLQRLVIVADRELQFIPFCCVRLGNRYLVERFELIYWPSVTAWILCDHQIKLWRDGKDEALASVVLGDPFFENPYRVPGQNGDRKYDLSQLVGSEDEARTIGLRLGIEPLLREHATIAALLDACRHGVHGFVPIVHIASHGVLDMSTPEDSFVALADGALTARFLYNFDAGLRIDLVVLSGCQTGLGDVHPDSLIGLANAFLVAGACSVMSTLWQVPDEQTRQLTTSFYDLLLEGQEPALTLSQALTQAQRRLLADPVTSHPYHWAAFKITGADDNPCAVLQDHRSRSGRPS